MKLIRKKFVKVTLCTVICAAFLAPSGFAQQSIKIGYVDLMEVFDKGAKFKQTKNDLRQILNEKRDKIQQLTRNWIQERDQFLVQQELLPAETAKERQQKLVDEQRQLLEMQKTEEVEFDKTKQEKIEPLIKEIELVVQAVAKDEGYAIVFHRSALLYGDPQYDITAKVIDRVNK